MTHSKLLGKLIASCLCLGLLGIPATAVNARPLIASTIAQAPNSAPTSNTISQQLLGQWQAKDASGQSLTFVFAPEGKLFLMAEVSDGSVRAKEMRYKIDPNSQPMTLDVSLNKTDTVLTVFELTAANQMRLQLAGTNPGQPRPKSLDAEATLFQKVSDTTALPANTQVISF
ncbi:MAG: hypothetical protein ACM37W_24655 [Actinomycetota bacterium]